MAQAFEPQNPRTSLGLTLMEELGFARRLPLRGCAMFLLRIMGLAVFAAMLDVG